MNVSQQLFFFFFLITLCSSVSTVVFLFVDFPPRPIFDVDDFQYVCIVCWSPKNHVVTHKHTHTHNIMLSVAGLWNFDSL